MNLESISEGLIVKNYKEMCRLLNEKEKTGQSRQIQIQDWERYFKFMKDGQKYIITEIFDSPKNKINNRGKSDGSRRHNVIYVKYIEVILLHKLLSCKDNTLVCVKNYLLPMLGMVNNKYLDKEIRYNLIENKLFNANEIREFDIRAYNILDRILFSALNSLKNRFLINWKQELHYEIYDYDKKEMVDGIATEDEEIEYISAKYEIAKQMGIDEGKPEKYDKLRDIFFYNKSEEFYDLLHDKMFDKFEWQSTYICYRIIFKKENVIDAIPRTENQLKELVKQYKYDLNDKVIIALNNNAQSKYDNLILKYDDEYNNLCLLNNTDDIPSNIISSYKPPKNYVDKQKLIAEKLIRLK